MDVSHHKKVKNGNFSRKAPLFCVFFFSLIFSASSPTTAGLRFTGHTGEKTWGLKNVNASVKWKKRDMKNGKRLRSALFHFPLSAPVQRPRRFFLPLSIRKHVERAVSFMRVSHVARGVAHEHARIQTHTREAPSSLTCLHSCGFFFCHPEVAVNFLTCTTPVAQRVRLGFDV